jgi:hypothetical protein
MQFQSKYNIGDKVYYFTISCINEKPLICESCKQRLPNQDQYIIQVKDDIISEVHMSFSCKGSMREYYKLSRENRNWTSDVMHLYDTYEDALISGNKKLIEDLDAI